MRFGNWKDRVTYVLGEAQLLVGATIVVVGVLLAWYQPTIPAAPRWMVDFLAALFILGPPLFIGGLKLADWLRTRNHVEVYEINAVEDTTEKWLVPPETWRDKTVENADPWPVNGGSAWAVRSFEWHDGIEELTVEGVWLSELSDDKLLTAQRHMEEVHGSLLKKYLELSGIRDRVSYMGAEIQETLVNEGAKAREKGELLDADAVEDSYQDAKDDAEGLGADDLPTIEETIGDDLDPTPETTGSQDATARTDGGEP